MSVVLSRRISTPPARFVATQRGFFKEACFVFEQAFKNIDDVLWKEAGCTTELDYTTT